MNYFRTHLNDTVTKTDIMRNEAKLLVTWTNSVYGELFVGLGETDSGFVRAHGEDTPWLLLNFGLLDVTNAQSWKAIFGEPGDVIIGAIKMEHVLEHFLEHVPASILALSQ